MATNYPGPSGHTFVLLLPINFGACRPEEREGKREGEKKKEGGEEEGEGGTVEEGGGIGKLSLELPSGHSPPISFRRAY